MKKQGLLLIVATLLLSAFVLVAYQTFSVSDHQDDTVLNDPNLALTNDPDNPGDGGELLPKGENEDARTEAPLSFKNYQKMMQYHNHLEVAGYGSSTGGFGTMTSLGQFTFFSVQIPGEKKFQVFVYGRKQESAPYVFVDHFIMPGVYPPMLTFTAEGDQLIYQHETSGKTIKRKKVERI